MPNLKKNKDPSIRICKISFSFPTTDSPGAGLTVFKPSCFIKEPTLYLTPYFKNSEIQIPSHIHVQKLKMISMPIWRNLSNIKLLKRAGQLLFFGEFSIRCFMPVIRFKPDILFVGLSNLIPAVLLKWICKCRLALSLHNVTDVEIILKNKYLSWISGKADVIFVVSKNMKTLLQTVLKDSKIVIRPTGVDLNTFYPKLIPINSRKKQIITIGSFKWKKGYSFLIKAMKDYVDIHPDYSLLIIGSGPGQKHVEDLIAKIGLRKYTKLLNNVSQNKIAKLLNESSLFVLASVREGLPKALLESLACGTPAVVTSTCNCGEFIHEAGLEVPDKDASALTHAMKHILDNKAIWTTFAKNAPQIANEFSWEKMAHIEYNAMKSIF